MDKRIFKRLFTRVRADYGVKGYEHVGYVLNVSTHGLFLSGRALYNHATPLKVRLQPSGVPHIDLEGVARWGKAVPAALSQVVRQGMGVRVENPPADYLTWFGTVLAAYPGARQHPRVEAQLELRFNHHQDFFREYTENLSQGGLFVATERVFERDTILVIEMTIPDIAKQLTINGRVVYQLDAERAAALGQRAGVGLELIDVDPETREIFADYVRRIERYYEGHGRALKP